MKMQVCRNGGDILVYYSMDGYSLLIQNVLRAPKSGTVKSLPRKVGAHLKVDDVIAEFD